MLLTHGIPKIQSLFGPEEIEFPDPFGLGPGISLALAVFAEVICSVLVILGFKTKLAVIPIIITMLVAAFYAHWADPFGYKELSLLYCAVFLSLLFTGAGQYSIDGAKR